MGLSSSGQYVSLALRPDRPLPSGQIREEEQPVLQIPNRQVQQASRYFLYGEGQGFDRTLQREPVTSGLKRLREN